MRPKRRRTKRLLTRLRKVEHLVYNFKKDFNKQKALGRLAECLKDPTLTDEAIYEAYKKAVAAAENE